MKHQKLKQEKLKLKQEKLKLKEQEKLKLKEQEKQKLKEEKKQKLKEEKIKLKEQKQKLKEEKIKLKEQEKQKLKEESKNSIVAKSGHIAEEIFRTNSNIKIKLESYFKKNIISFKKIHARKYDTQIYFEDGSIVNIQNKKIESLSGRGDSFDRRHIKDTFTNHFIKKYLTLLTLVREKKNETLMNEQQKKDFIKLCNNNLDDIKQYIKKTLIGTEKEINDYFCIMKTNKSFTDIELYMISSKKLHYFIEQTIKIDIKLKKNGTCLHLSPYISLQRKGGSNTDNYPNHIQCKFKFTQEILNLCDKLLLKN